MLNDVTFCRMNLGSVPPKELRNDAIFLTENDQVHVAGPAGDFAAGEKIGRLVVGKIEMVLPGLSQPW